MRMRMRMSMSMSMSNSNSKLLFRNAQDQSKGRMSNSKLLLKQECHHMPAGIYAAASTRALLCACCCCVGLLKGGACFLERLPSRRLRHLDSSESRAVSNLWLITSHCALSAGAARLRCPCPLCRFPVSVIRVSKQKSPNPAVITRCKLSQNAGSKVKLCDCLPPCVSWRLHPKSAGGRPPWHPRSEIAATPSVTTSTALTSTCGSSAHTNICG